MRGGHWRRLAEAPWRHLSLIFVAFAIQAALAQAGNRGLTVIAPLAPWVHLSSYGLLLAAIWANRQLPGMAWIGLGTLANFAVIATNGGRMPVSASALVAVGGEKTAPFLAGHGDFIHRLQTADTRLPFLGDVFYIPPPLSVPVLFSFGDTLIAIGLFLLVQRVMLSPGSHEGKRGQEKERQ